MFERDENLDSHTLRNIFNITLVSSILITIINRLNIDQYTKTIILPIIIILLGYTIFMNTLKSKINLKSYIYLGLIILILLSHFIVPLAEVNMFLNIIVIAVLTSIYIYSLINPNYKLEFKFIRWFTKLFPGYLFSNMEYIGPSIKSTNANNKKNSLIIKGILITIPIMIVVLILLTHADAYFKMFITRILDVINIDISIDTLVSIIITLVLSFIFVFSTITNIYQTRNIDVHDPQKKKVENIISYILLGVISFVYILFLISEISKLTTNFLNVPVEYTYAKYAREGFFELLGVSTINIAIIIFYLKIADYEDNKIIKGLLLFLIVFSIFIIINSYYRMALYIFEYTFTILRLQVILFLTMELILFMILTFRVLNRRVKERPHLYFVILITTYFLNIYLCQSNFIEYINSLFIK